MIAWGKTGRVTLDESSRKVCNNVLIDGKVVGLADQSGRTGLWLAAIFDSVERADDLASRDAAVMWVLRRVDPRLWREERGSVWLVRKRRGEEYIEDGWYTGRRHPAIHDWLIIDPAGVCRDAIRTSTLARITARHYAEMTPR